MTEAINAYLFVTDKESRPEFVKTGEETWWSCSKSARQYDVALVYVKGEGITYQWRITSEKSRKASPDKTWKYECDIEYARTFEPPITLDEICSVVDEDTWKPPYQNFRGCTAIVIPPEAAIKILGLRE